MHVTTFCCHFYDRAARLSKKNCLFRTYYRKNKTYFVVLGHMYALEHGTCTILKFLYVKIRKVRAVTPCSLV
jgi:hypothetical protein